MAVVTRSNRVVAARTLDMALEDGSIQFGMCAIPVTNNPTLLLHLLLHSLLTIAARCTSFVNVYLFNRSLLRLLWLNKHDPAGCMGAVSRHAPPKVLFGSKRLSSGE